MRVLLTAFEPFDGSGRNSSLEACRHFLSRWPGRFELSFAVLPVEYDGDTGAVEAALRETPADLLLHTGQSGRAPAVMVERLAVNVRFRDSRPEGPDPPQQPIDPDGPAAYLATLPVERLAAAIREAGVPAAVSNHAGIYLCNHVFYRSLQRATRSGLAARAGFLHLPLIPGQAPAGFCLAPEQGAAAIRATLEALLRDG